MLVNLSVRRGVCRHQQRFIPQRTGAQHDPGGMRTHTGSPLYLPIEAGKWLVEARITRRQSQLALIPIIQNQVGRQLIQMISEFGFELGLDVPMKEFAQPPACNQNRYGDPEERPHQQTHAQGVAQEGKLHCALFSR